MRTWALGQLGHVAAAVNPFETEELAELRNQSAKKNNLVNMPLILLTRGISEKEGPDSSALEAEHRKEHAALAALSKNGKLIVAEHSGHHIQIEEPDLVIDTIRDVMRALRK